MPVTGIIRLSCAIRHARTVISARAAEGGRAEKSPVYCIIPILFSQAQNSRSVAILNYEL